MVLYEHSLFNHRNRVISSLLTAPTVRAEDAEQDDAGHADREHVPVQGDVETVQERRVLVVQLLEGVDAEHSGQTQSDGHHPQHYRRVLSKSYTFRFFTLQI